MSKQNALLPTLLQADSPSQTKMRQIALVGAGVLLVALAARLQIVLPFSPVPITGQTLAVFLIASTYGARLGLSTIGAYILAGVLGLPVFASGLVGVGALVAPGGGYIIGYFAGTALCGYLAERGWSASVPKLALALILGHAMMYVCGLAQLSFYVKDHVLAAGLYPFIVGDSIKILLVMVSLPVTWKLFKRFQRK